MKRARDEGLVGEPLVTVPRTMVLAVTTLGGFLVAFMSSSVNIALPLIQSEFHTSAVMLSWISLAFILVSAATLLPVGRVSDVHGRVRFFAIGQVVFAVFAFASAFAPSANVLLLFRLLHGPSNSIGMVTATALVVLAFPPETRGRALGLNVSGIYLGLMLGPVLGGLIVHNLGWRSLFLILGSLGAVNAGLTTWGLRNVEWREPARGRFDFAGSFISGIALVVLLVGFTLLPAVIGLGFIVAGVAGLVLFLWWETRAVAPLLRVDLLRSNRVFAFSSVATFINYAATAGMVFLMSLYLQYNRGLNAETAGFVLVASSFFQVALSPLAGRLADRAEGRYVAAAGMALSAVGLLALGFVGKETPYWYLIAVLSLLGVGYAFFSTPNTHTVMGSVSREDLGIASATLSTMRITGQTISMGLAALVLAVLVGRHEVTASDYPQVLTSVRVSFLIFTALCGLGVGASLVGPRRRSETVLTGHDTGDGLS